MDVAKGKIVTIGNKDMYFRKLSDDEIINNALKKMNKKGYNIIFYNCEHYVFGCRYGIYLCEQAFRFTVAMAFLASLVCLLQALKGESVFFMNREKSLHVCLNGMIISFVLFKAIFNTTSSTFSTEADSAYGCQELYFQTLKNFAAFHTNW
uniref:LRAT domain-containing protein n=1 Tax=Biomphalaria glabrata TaxID=6526 RepID=A0A2C9KP72_BIOGL